MIFNLVREKAVCIFVRKSIQYNTINHLKVL